MLKKNLISTYTNHSIKYIAYIFWIKILLRYLTLIIKLCTIHAIFNNLSVKITFQENKQIGQGIENNSCIVNIGRKTNVRGHAIKNKFLGLLLYWIILMYDKSNLFVKFKLIEHISGMTKITKEVVCDQEWVHKINKSKLDNRHVIFIVLHRFLIHQDERPLKIYKRTVRFRDRW